MASMFGGIEAGGTKFICAVGTGPDDLRAEARFPTTTPEATIHSAIEFFRQQTNRFGKLEAIGVASFGPLDPRPDSPTYGYITTTPKPGWANTNFIHPLQEAFEVPVGFDTDVNAAAFGEYRWGAGQDLDTILYLTIGTGIGGGAVVGGKIVHGLLHPEMGHIHIPHDRQADPYEGYCPYHQDCFEGLACGPAIEKRWGRRGESLPANHPAWEMEANYLALALANYVFTLSPQRIILGGGVMQQTQLFPLIRARLLEIINGYLRSPQILSGIDEYIVPPGLGSRSGVLGAIALAIAQKQSS